MPKNLMMIIFNSKNDKSNPFNNMVMVDGFIVPLDSIPEDLQELVKKKRSEGRDIEFTTQPEYLLII